MSSRLAIRAMLVDLGGTTCEAGRPVSGAGAALQALAARGIPHIFVTNTTSRPRSDLDVDVEGGMALGKKEILVRTGKFRQEELARSSVRPDAVIDSLAELPRVLAP